MKILVDIDQAAIDAAATRSERNFNALSPAQTERLAILSEELAEAVQAVSKIIRHGYSSYHPQFPSVSNRLHLQDELGHVQNAIAMLVSAGDVDQAAIDAQRVHKSRSIKQYLHHN